MTGVEKGGWSGRAGLLDGEDGDGPVMDFL